MKIKKGFIRLQTQIPLELLRLVKVRTAETGLKLQEYVQQALEVAVKEKR